MAYIHEAVQRWYDYGEIPLYRTVHAQKMRGSGLSIDEVYELYLKDEEGQKKFWAEFEAAKSFINPIRYEMGLPNRNELGDEE